ncbi:MAG TPA: PQQ-binding-like beta-propeller repeat protein [Armatimonadota bacterium]|jgi:hypothetical protein
MRNARSIWALAAFAAAAVAGAPAAQAAAHSYNTRVQTIRCGVVLASRDSWSDAFITPLGNGNAHVFSLVFHALNARPDIRPYGWEILNPSAAPFWDQSMATRYGLGTLAAGMAPRLNKDQGPYWEIYLHEVNADQLCNYDILYMPLPLDEHGSSNTLGIDDREKLRRAVDGGAVLWLDNVAPTVTTAPGPTKVFIQPTFAVGAAGSQNQVGDTLNALMNAPNPLTAREIRRLGRNNYRTNIGNIITDGAEGFAADVLKSSLEWKTVVQTAIGGKPTVAVASYGQGAVVVTSRGVGAELSQGFRSGGDARFIPTAELKFLVNLIAYRFQSPQSGMGPRHASGSRQDLNSPLGSKWQFPAKYGQGYAATDSPFVSDPVVWNGILYAATSDGFLRAYDLDPTRDLDGDGNPNDGLQDGTYPGCDILWQAKLPGPACSSLVVADNENKPVLYGMLQDGRAFNADAMPRVGGRISGTPRINVATVDGFGAYPKLFENRMTTTTFAPGEEKVYRIPAPVMYNGRLFVVGQRKNPDAAKGIGAVAELDPSSLRTLWECPDGTTDTAATVDSQSRMGLPSATPTIAAIPDKGYSGATDIMLIVPTLSIRSTDNVGALQASRIMAFPIGVRGEKLQFNGAADTANWGFNTRFAGATAIQTTKPICYDSSGTKYTGTMRVDATSGLNRMYVDLTGNLPPLEDVNDLRADYDFIPQMPADKFRGYNARWSFDAWSYILGTVNKFMEITTTPVVDSDGGIYFVASDFGDGGNQPPIITGVTMRQQSLGFNVLNNPRYLPPLNNPQLTFIYSMGTSTGTPSGTPVPQPVTLGTAAVDRGILYVPWGSWNASSSAASSGGVTGFFVKGTTFGLLLHGPVDPAQKSSVLISQRNRFTGDLQQVGYGVFDVDNINYGNQLRGLITFRTLSSGVGAPAIDLSRPADILVSYQMLDVLTGTSTPQQNDIPDVYYKTLRGEGFNPNVLLAFDATVPGATSANGVASGRAIRTGVTVSGGSIYAGSDSGDVWTVPLPTDLEVVGFLTTGSPTSRTMLPATFPNLTVSAGFGTAGYPTDPKFAMRANPVICSGTLIMNSPVGMYTFYSPRTLITDANRVLEVVSDYSKPDKATPGVAERAGSAVVWSLDSTVQAIDFGTPGIGPEHPPWGGVALNPLIEKSLNQPTMAIRVNTTNTLICDTGNNRVVEVDRSGRVVWQVTEVADPYGLLGANESHALNSPTSVQRWESYSFDEEGVVPAREQHTLVADYGNNRILEIVSRFSPDAATQASNIVVWVGNGPEGAGYKFYQAQREALHKPGDPNDGSMDYGRTIASVVNVSVNTADIQLAEMPGARTNRPATPGGSIVILSGLKDAIGGTDVGRRGRVVWFLNRMQYEKTTTEFPLTRPVYFDHFTTGVGAFDWRVTVTDGQNVFDLWPDLSKPGVGIIPVGLDGPLLAYRTMDQSSASTGVGTSGLTVGTVMAKHMANGDILIVNQKTGNVVEYSPRAMVAALQLPPGKDRDDALLNAFRFTAPPISGTAALTRPTFADRIF